MTKSPNVHDALALLFREQSVVVNFVADPLDLFCLMSLRNGWRRSFDRHLILAFFGTGYVRTIKRPVL